HPADRRERLKTEFGFSTFLWERGIRNIPRPVAKDFENRLGLYSFMEGSRVAQTDVTAPRVREALEFLLAVNRHRGEDEARALAPASEACFSLDEHIRQIDRRLDRLQKIEESEAKAFVLTRLRPAWREIRKNILRVDKTEWNSPVRVLSPSDFGFHNALLTPRGKIVFHDFEYAGWDDPAKTVCEFFSQPEVSVPIGFLEDFANEVFVLLKDPAGLERVHLLLPVYRIKWCSTLLNEFLPEGAGRRQFAEGKGTLRVKRQKQLAKAVNYLDRHA
ncbi:MAG: phosphotransferase, partial [Deltaproteobacteria bacterium]|nr:phosphotransferase [Deltaproteobacteria bacterium]